jgi:hypothetical protein
MSQDSQGHWPYWEQVPLSVLAKRGHQDLDVLHDRNQVVLNLHPPLSAPSVLASNRILFREQKIVP